MSGNQTLVKSWKKPRLVNKDVYSPIVVKEQPSELCAFVSQI